MRERRGAIVRPPRHLFVYGTLRPSLGHAAAGLLADVTRSLGAAVVAGGALFDLGRYPGMTLDATPADSVRGEVVALEARHARALLARLDAYEGDEYRRLRVEARLDDERTVRADAYVLRTAPPASRRIVGGDWAAVRGDR